MQQTISKIKSLEKFLKRHGDDSYISGTLSKMIGYKIQKYTHETESLANDLKQFEKKYEMSSDDFFKKFQDGGIGDEMDFIEWSAIYQMHNNLLDKKRELEEIND